MLLQKYWIPLLVFIVAIAGVGLYSVHTRPPKEPIVMDKGVEPIEKPTQQPKAEVVADETDTGGDFHADGTWHEGPHLSNEQQSPAEKQLPEQRAQIEKMRAEQLAEYVAKWGEPPSPDGSYQHYRDNHGEVHRHYRGTVAIQDYEYTTMFAPTPAELERYKQLRVALKDATSADEVNGGSWENPSPEVQRLNNEIKSLVDSAQQKIPYPTGFVYIGESNSGFLSPPEEKRLNAVAIRAFYKRFGMEHLYELHNESTQFYQKYE